MKTVINHLVSGDPLSPQAGDVIAQIAVLNVWEPVPEGWRVLTGNANVSKIARIVLRGEIEGPSNESA